MTVQFFARKQLCHKLIDKLGLVNSSAATRGTISMLISSQIPHFLVQTNDDLAAHLANQRAALRTYVGVLADEKTANAAFEGLVNRRLSFRHF